MGPPSQCLVDYLDNSGRDTPGRYYGETPYRDDEAFGLFNAPSPGLLERTGRVPPHSLQKMSKQPRPEMQDTIPPVSGGTRHWI